MAETVSSQVVDPHTGDIKGDSQRVPCPEKAKLAVPDGQPMIVEGMQKIKGNQGLGFV